MNNEPILLLGNGINRAFAKHSDDNWQPTEKTTNFKNMSWENIIRQLLFNSDSKLKYNDIEKLPFTMQIVVATKDNVKDSMKSLAEKMVEDILDENEKILLEKIVNLPIENILTTNYSYELEQAGGIPARKHSYYKCRENTENVSKTVEKLRLYTYSYLPECNKKVWHIHGDAATPDSVIMGQFYYGKLLREIQNRLKGFMPYCKGCIKYNKDFATKSWVDLFLTRDVYMLGFGFDFSEMDLWWLTACKKKDFPETKIHYYAPKGELKPDKRALLEAYNVNIYDDFEISNRNYIEYYEKAIQDITHKLKEGKK